MGTKRCLLPWFLSNSVLEVLASVIRPPLTKKKKGRKKKEKEAEKEGKEGGREGEREKRKIGRKEGER